MNEENITRFDLDMDGSMEPSDGGQWVRYEDHLAEIAQRKPLTVGEIGKLRGLIDWTAGWSYVKFARAIEAAHGIKDDNDFALGKACDLSGEGTCEACQ